MGLSTPKVTIVGAGNVGEATANALLRQNLADVVLLDKKADIAKGKALDIGQACAIELRNRTILGTGSYEDTKDSDIIVITAGLPRVDGQSREDLLKVNAEIVSGVTEEAVKYSPNCKIIVVSNPVDVMTYQAWFISKLDKNKVMGMAGVLDSGRMTDFIRKKLREKGIEILLEEIKTIVLGGHGDQMVPLIRLTTVSGKPITDYLSPQEIIEICEKTRNGGGEIIKLTGRSSYSGAGSAVSKMVEAILGDENDKVIPVVAYVNGEYGLTGLFLGVPAKLGKDGVKEIIEFDLAHEELENFYISAALVKNGVNELNKLALV